MNPSVEQPPLDVGDFPVLSALAGPQQLTPAPTGGAAGAGRVDPTLLVGTVCATGGHLGASLGAVELTIALHRVFDSPARRDFVRPPATRPIHTRC